MVGYRNQVTRGERKNSILSGIPMVGYRNSQMTDREYAAYFIRHSDGGVSEPTA